MHDDRFKIQGFNNGEIGQKTIFKINKRWLQEISKFLPYINEIIFKKVFYSYTYIETKELNK